MNGDTFVVVCILLLTANSANANYFGQFFCLWSTKNRRCYSNSWFIHSVCLLVWGWKAVNSFVLIPNILFNFLVNSVANCSPLSDTTLSGKLCNLYILSLNNLANPSAIIPSITATKCVIFYNLLQTTRIAFVSATISNLVIKFTKTCVQDFSETSPSFNFSTTSSVLFFIH